jgi:hypothetical protein
VLTETAENQSQLYPDEPSLRPEWRQNQDVRGLNPVWWRHEVLDELLGEVGALMPHPALVLRSRKSAVLMAVHGPGTKRMHSCQMTIGLPFMIPQRVGVHAKSLFVEDVTDNVVDCRCHSILLVQEARRVGLTIHHGEYRR